MKNASLVIVGTGLFAEVAMAYFEEFTPHRIAAFSCHADYKKSQEIDGRPLVALEDLPRTHPPETHSVFVAAGYKNMNAVRQALYDEVKLKGYHCVNFVHPGVKIWPSTTLGDNVFIFEDNTIQPFTKIGCNTVLWSGNHIGHHSQIGDHCFISSHVVVSGSCRIGNNVFIGVNATLRDEITIADYTLIGAGAVMMNDTKEREVYAPHATKPFPKRSDQVGF